MLIYDCTHSIKDTHFNNAAHQVVLKIARTYRTLYQKNSKWYDTPNFHQNQTRLQQVI